MEHKPQPGSEIVLYQTDDGRTRLTELEKTVKKITPPKPKGKKK